MTMMKLMRYTMIFLMLALLSSCMTSSDRNRGSLSGAMDKARDDHEGSREVPDEPDPWWERDDRDEWRDDDPPRRGDNTIGDYNYSSDESYIFGVRLVDSAGGSPYYSSQTGFELVLAVDEKSPLDIYFFAGAHYLETLRTHELYDSIGEGSLLFSAGADARFYLFDNQMFFSPYVGGRIGGIYMTWSYENPLTAGADTIFSDAVGGVSLGVFAGVDLIKTDFFRLGAQIMPTAYFFSGETSQGFDNDYFGVQGMIRTGIEGGLRF